MAYIDNLVEIGAKDLLGFRLGIFNPADLNKLWADVDERLRNEYRDMAKVVVTSLVRAGAVNDETEFSGDFGLRKLRSPRELARAL